MIGISWVRPRAPTCERADGLNALSSRTRPCSRPRGTLSSSAYLPIDWANVNWPYVIALVLLVFVCTVIGTSLSFRRTFLGAVLTALLFGAAFVYWTYYPHGLPLPTLGKAQEAAPAQAAPPPPATAATPAKPDNPVTTISPPADSQQR